MPNANFRSIRQKFWTYFRYPLLGTRFEAEIFTSKCFFRAAFCIRRSSTINIIDISFNVRGCSINMITLIQLLIKYTNKENQNVIYIYQKVLNDQGPALRDFGHCPNILNLSLTDHSKIDALCIFAYSMIVVLVRSF